MEKVKEVILYILEVAGSLTKTKLVKLLFLSDKLAKKNIGKTITNLNYVKYFYGPYAKEIETLLNELYAKKFIYYEENISFEGRRYYLLSRGDKKVVFNNLNDEEKRILSEITKDNSNKKLEDILETVYSFKEVESTNFGERINI